MELKLLKWSGDIAAAPTTPQQPSGGTLGAACFRWHLALRLYTTCSLNTLKLCNQPGKKWSGACRGATVNSVRLWMASAGAAQFHDRAHGAMRLVHQ